MSQFLGRYTLTAGKTTIASVPTDGVAAIVISNDSAFSVVATLEGGGSSLNIPAGVADMMQVQNRSFTGNLLLAASSQLSIQNSPANQAEINIYGVGEQIPSVYPLSLNRLSNTGNDVGTQGILRSSSSATINNGSLSFGGVAGKTPYLKSFTVTVGQGGASASGTLKITGLDATLNGNGGEMDYELWCATGAACSPISENFDTPLPGLVGGSITITGPSLSTAVIAVSFTYYLN